MLQLQFVNFRAGSYILVEGKNNANVFYIIQKGFVQCFKASNPSAISKMGPGAGKVLIYLLVMFLKTTIRLH